MEASSTIGAAFFEAMFKASPLAIVVLDRDGRVASWNPAAQRIFGWSESEVLGQRPPFVPDDKQGEFLAVHERELTGEFLDGVALCCRRKEGTPIDVRLWAAPLRDASGRVTDVLGMLEDVTDRQRAEAARRESDAQRDAVLQNVPVVLYRAQASGPSAGIWVSENVERLTGFPAARFTAEPSFWASRLHPEDRDEVFNAMPEGEESAFLTWQYRWQCADGTYRWFLDQARLPAGHGEGPPEYVGTWFDITERKQAEILVRAQRDLALALASTSTLEEGLRCCLDTACEVAHLDAGGFYLADEQTGALDLRMHRGLSSAFVRSVASYGPESPHAHLLMAGKPVYAAHRNLGLPLSEAEQQEALRFVAVIPVLNEGRVLGCMNVASHVVDDISDTARDALEAIRVQIGHAIARLETEEALRKSDERFRRLVANTDTGFVVIDDAGVVLEANEPYRRLAGRGRMEDIIGHSVIEWTVPEERERNAAAVALCARQGQIQDFETVYRHEDGKRVHVLINAVVEQRVGATGIVSYCRDITDRKETEAALVLQRNQLDAIRAVTMELTQTLELAPLLDLIHRRAVELVGVRSGVLYLWDEAAQVLESRVRYGYSLDLPAVRLRMGEGVAGAVAQRREGLVVNDFRTSPYMTAWSAGHTTHTAVLAEPMLHRDRLLGVISLSNIQIPERMFTRADQDLLRLFAAQAAIAIENARLFQDVERQQREIETVADLSQRLNASLDFDTILQRVVEGARDLTASDLAQIALRDDPSGALVFRYRAGSHSKRLDTHRIELGKGIGGTVMGTGQPFRTDNYAEDPRITKEYLTHTLAEDVVAELAVPIRMEGRVEGVLFVDHRSPRPFTDRDERTLLQLADHAATAIRNARFHATAVKRAQQLATLNTVMRAMTTELDALLVARRILDAVEVLIPNAAGLLFDLPEGTQVLRVVASIGLRDADGARSLSLRVGEGFAGIAAATRQPVVSTGVAWDARFVKRSWAAKEGLVSGIVLPLVFSSRVTGALAVFLRRLHTFPKEEIDVLQALAAQSANALENARLFEQVDLARERLLDLTQRVVSAQEEERGRLARELHDEAGQALTALRIGLGLIRDDLPGDAASLRQRLEDTMKLTESITDQLRFLAQALHPPGLEAAGLDSTLEGLCRDFNRRTQIAVEYAGADLPRLRDNVGIHLYRFLQEALTNVSKHAHARRVRVGLTYDSDVLSLSVEDDGVGFDVARQLAAKSRGGIGLVGMRERMDLLNGRLEITSQPGQGTRLLARVPWRVAQ